MERCGDCERHKDSKRGNREVDVTGERTAEKYSPAVGTAGAPGTGSLRRLFSQHLLLEQADRNIQHVLEQRSPDFWSPGNYFVEDNFSKEQGWEDGFGVIQAHFIYCAPYF